MNGYIGLDIGGTKCAVVLGFAGDTDVQIIEKYKFPTPAGAPAEVLACFENKIRELCARQPIAGIGISCGGPLNSKQGVILSPPNLPGWDQIEIVRYFHDRFGLPVYLQNDANACAVAEWKYGAGQGYDNVVFLTFGTGLGAGMILNGRLYTGANDMAGEVGHWRLSETGPVGYGKSGSFEGFCSGAGIAAMAREEVSSGSCRALLAAAGSPENITAKLVGDLADSGDEECSAIYARCGKMLGKGLSLIIDIMNPQVIIIGSIFTRSRHLLWRYAKDEIEKESLCLSRKICEVRPAMLGDNIGDYAALTVATGNY